MLPAYAGRTMQAELEALDKALEAPQRPVAAIVGGAKVSTKLDLLGNLVAKVDALVIGGGMANTFLLAQGMTVGKSLAEHDLADTARDILAKAEGSGCEIVLPVDAVVAQKFEANAPSRVVGVDAVAGRRHDPRHRPAQRSSTSVSVLGDARRRWSGTGRSAPSRWSRSTPARSRSREAAAELTSAGKLVSVAGGGDTVAALNAAGVADRFHLCLDRRRRLPGMDGRQAAARASRC